LNNRGTIMLGTAEGGLFKTWKSGDLKKTRHENDGEQKRESERAMTGKSRGGEKGKKELLSEGSRKNCRERGAQRKNAPARQRPTNEGKGGKRKKKKGTKIRDLARRWP